MWDEVTDPLHHLEHEAANAANSYAPTSPLWGGRRAQRSEHVGWGPPPEIADAISTSPQGGGGTHERCAMRMRGKPNCKTNSVAALSNIARRHSEPLIWFALSSVSGFRLVPSDRPRASGVRLHTLGSGSPISVVSAYAAMTDTCRLFAGNNSSEPCFGKQKTLRSVGSGGSV